MRILAAADLHGSGKVYDWLLQKTAELCPDALILAGDLCESSWQEKEQQKSREAALSWIRKFECPVLYLMGNDDYLSLDYEDGRIQCLHNRRIEVGDEAFVGYQHSPPFIGGPHEKPDEQISVDLQKLEPQLDERTILVTHTPAYSSLDLTRGGEHVGSRALAALLERRPVAAHIHGHIHKCFGREGIHFNVASGGERRAMLIELPKLHHEVLRG